MIWFDQINTRVVEVDQATRVLRCLRHVPHEKMLGPPRNPLVGIPAILVSNQAEFNGDSDEGHDYLILRLSSEIYNFKSEAVNQSSSCYIIFLKSSHDVCLMQFFDGTMEPNNSWWQCTKRVSDIRLSKREKENRLWRNSSSEHFVGLLMKCLLHCPSSPILRVVNGKSICWLVQKTVKTGKANWAKPQVRSKNDSLRLHLARAVTKIGRGVLFLTSLI